MMSLPKDFYSPELTEELMEFFSLNYPNARAGQLFPLILLKLCSWDFAAGEVTRKLGLPKDLFDFYFHPFGDNWLMIVDLRRADEMEKLFKKSFIQNPGPDSLTQQD